MKNLLYLVLIASVTSCHLITPHSIKNEFTQCNTGSNQDKCLPFNTNGFWVYGMKNDYSYVNYNNETVYVSDSAFSFMLFFSDGMYVHISYETRLSLQTYFIEIHQLKLKGKKHWFYKTNDWGNYSVHSDTIKVKWVSKPSNFSDGWYLYENWYKIIDQSTIVKIESKQKFPYAPELAKFKISMMDGESRFVYKFFPFDSMPDSNGWIKKKKWFWCDGKVGK